MDAPAVCPVNTIAHSPRWTFHILTVPSSDDDASVCALERINLTLVVASRSASGCVRRRIKCVTSAL